MTPDDAVMEVHSLGGVTTELAFNFTRSKDRKERKRCAAAIVQWLEEYEPGEEALIATLKKYANK